MAGRDGHLHEVLGGYAKFLPNPSGHGRESEPEEVASEHVVETTPPVPDLSSPKCIGGCGICRQGGICSCLRATTHEVVTARSPRPSDRPTRASELKLMPSR